MATFLQKLLPYRYQGHWHLDPHSDYHLQTFDYSRLRIPFSKCYVFNHVRIKGEDVRKGRKGIFCGYVKDSTAYKIWVISASDYEFTADVTWDEQNLQPLLETAAASSSENFGTKGKPRFQHNSETRPVGRGRRSFDSRQC